MIPEVKGERWEGQFGASRGDEEKERLTDREDRKRDVLSDEGLPVNEPSVLAELH